MTSQSDLDLKLAVDATSKEVLVSFQQETFRWSSRTYRQKLAYQDGKWRLTRAIEAGMNWVIELVIDAGRIFVQLLCWNRRQRRVMRLGDPLLIDEHPLWAWNAVGSRPRLVRAYVVE